ncbi:amidohydrolase [Siculibacillus lacustris]|uniref:Amidohydrolase n=1 Tax=Siculibacillus lacustris TaxID=1549641 RepID=A0A4Q9VJK8_9HYPH|nr:M20 aminoacylase family protein [Siculibacillus lacustris]TBW35525.1 amidohydrolase [Siculibacillus lacustris]
MDVRLAPPRRQAPDDRAYPWIAEAIALRHDLHRRPETAFAEHRTAAAVAGALRSWGWAVTEGVGGTGVVATLRAGTGERRLGLRAELDALPIGEESGLPFASENPGVMHACGHDGHMAILLAAARRLAETRRFDGTVTAIFQPAEENGPGARAMIDDGLFERFPVDAVYALHNWPGLATGHFAILDGPVMAAADRAVITIRGRGGHGAAPQEAIDPVPAAASFVLALQTIVARNLDPFETAVVTVGTIHGGTAANVIPDAVELQLTARSFSPAVRQRVEARLRTLAAAQAESFGATATVDWRPGADAVVNQEAETALARRVAIETFGEEVLVPDFRPRTASEDFAHMLAVRPGAFLFVGNGDGAPLHSPHYRFDDAVVAPAARLWVRLAEVFLS